MNLNVFLTRGMGSDSTIHTSNQEQRANVVLSDADQDILRALLLEVWKGLDGLDAEILAIEAALDVLRRRRTKEAERIQKLQVGMTPHKRLPPELLAAIFVHCMEFCYAVDVVPRFRHGNLTPWPLTQVCSRWREIALAEPRLWKHIQFPRLDMPWPKNTTELMHDLCSRRGGEGKIKLRASPKCQDEWEFLLDLIHLYPSRIRGLAIGIRDSPSPRLDTPIKAFESLESLIINVALHDESPDRPPLAAFSLARNLRKVKILPPGYSHHHENG